MTTVDMWFDPKCPWAWIASRWLLEVEQVRPEVDVRFHVLSLALLNKDREVDGWYREWLDAAWGPARIAMAVGRKYGQGAREVRELYTAMGNRIHLDKQPLGRELYLAALAEVGLAAEFADAEESTAYDEALGLGNEAGLGPVGEDLGTPAIHVHAEDGAVNAFFGPVVTPIPRGEAAGKLWDGVLLVSATPGFYELKRARVAGPVTTG
jgi:protein-disulfide isomerase-like protein with CxxC motif